MNLVIPLIILISAIARIVTNSFIIKHDRTDWKDVLKKAIAIGLVMGVFLGFLNYFSMVKTISINIIILFMVIFTIAFWSVYILSKFNDFNKSNKLFFLPGIMLIFVLLVLSVSPLLMTKDLHSLTNVIEVQGKPVEIDTTHVRQVNYEYAKWKADKVVGEMGNRVMIGELEIILYKGNLTWVCPLIHRDFFKQWKFDITPGYILVDGENPAKEAVLIDNYPVDYSYQGEYFSQYMHRIVYNNYPSYDQHWAFEIDENGSPWVIVTLSRPTVSYSGDVAKHVLVVSPVDKSITTYAFGEQPGWIDNAFPEELAENYCEWWGSYKNGFWNTVFTEEDVKQPTAKNNAYSQEGGGFGTDVYMIVGADNQTYWFTDFTSPASSDQSMVGYILMNTRTGESNFYQVNGLLNGYAAMEATTAKVTNFQGWYATQPIFLIINGNETWFTPIHSGTNILQKVALVRALDGEVTLGDTLEDVLLAFSTDEDETGTVYTISGNVSVVHSYVVDGATEWYIEVNETVMYAYSEAQPFLIEIGDNITVEYKIINDRNIMVRWD